MCFSLLGRGGLFKVVADGDVVAFEFTKFGAPGVVGVDVGKGDDGAASERAHLLFAELGFAAGGEPDVFWHEGCADDGGLFAFDKGDAASRVLREA